MRTRTIKIKISDIYTVLVLITVFVRVLQGMYGPWMGTNSFNRFCTLVKYGVAAALIALMLLERRISLFKALFKVCIVAAIGIIVLFGYQKTLAISLIFIVAYPNLDSRKLIKNIGVFLSVCLVVSIFLSQVGVLTDFVSRRLEGGGLRHGFGFVTSSACSAFYTVIVLCFTYAYFDKLTFKSIVMMLVGELIIYHFTGTRVGLFLILADLLICVWYIIKRLYTNRSSGFLTNHSFVFFVLSTFISWAITVYCGYHEWSSEYIRLNNLLSGRVMHQVDYYKTYGIHFMGSETILVGRVEQYLTGKAWNGVDNSYVFSLVTFGIFGFGVIAVIFYLLSREARRAHNSALSVYLVMLSLLGLTEAIFSELPYNLTFILAGELMSNTLMDHKMY